MMNNNEFKQLVREKHRDAQKKRRQRIVRCNSALTVVACIVLSVSIIFVSNNGFNDDIFKLFADKMQNEYSPEATDIGTLPVPNPTQSISAQTSSTQCPVTYPTESARNYSVTVEIYRDGSRTRYDFSDACGEENVINRIYEWVFYVYNENVGEELTTGATVCYNECIKITLDTNEPQSRTFTLLDGKYMNMADGAWITLDRVIDTEEFIDELNEYK